MPFRFKAKYGLLTYAQCGDLSAEAVGLYLSTLGAECIIGREDHADGGIHLHVFFMFEEPFQSRNERIFDVDGRHPNIVKGYGTPWGGFDYAIKEGDVVWGGLGRPAEPGQSKEEKEAAKVEKLRCAQSKEEFFEICWEVYGSGFLKIFNGLRAYAEWHFRPTLEPYQHPSGIRFNVEGIVDVNHGATLESWYDVNVRNFTGSG